MKNKIEKSYKNFFGIQNKIFNNKKEEYKTFTNNKPIIKLSLPLNTDIIIQKGNNTISYIKPKNFNYFSEDLKKIKLIINRKANKKIKNEDLSDKINQTPANFYLSSRREFFNKSQIILKNHIKMLKINYKVFPNNDIIKNKNKKNKFSFPSKSAGTRNSILKNLFFQNLTKSRNKLKPILNFKKIISNKNKKINFDINNNISVSERRKHKNLFSLENIYIQNKKKYKLNNKPSRNYINVFNIQRMKFNSIKNNNNKYSIKEIKYPLLNDKYKNIKVINESNEHLIEKIYKNQTVSNFNNKYKIIYKSNDMNKKENMKNLFFLLNKFKNSDKDKKKIFLFYKKINAVNQNYKSNNK